MKKKSNFKKYIKIGLGAVLIFNVGLIAYLISNTKSTPSNGIVEPEWFSDKCEEEEFYNKTHNEDETLNDYGKSLI